MELLVMIGMAVLTFVLIAGLICLVFYRLITSNTLPLTVYVLLCVVGGWVIGPAILGASTLDGVRGGDLFSMSLYYGVIGGIIASFVCLIVGGYLILVKQQSQARKILKIPIIYASIWIICFISASVLSSVF